MLSATDAWLTRTVNWVPAVTCCTTAPLWNAVAIVVTELNKAVLERPWTNTSFFVVRVDVNVNPEK